MISDRRIEIYRAGALGARRYRCSDLRGIDVDVLAEKVEHVLYGHGSRNGGKGRGEAASRWGELSLWVYQL
jgi:hypothetical protein